MFRRNQHRRFGPRIGRGPLARPALQALNQAHRLMAAGEYRQAAELFSQLSRGAKSLGRPQQAANLQAQAGLAWAEAGQPGEAVQQGSMALRGFLGLKMMPRYHGYLNLLTATLRRMGYMDAAGQIQGEFAIQEPLQPEAPQVQNHTPDRPRLPAACTQCGAPVRSDEVDWIDEYSAECAFCGAVLQGD